MRIKLEDFYLDSFSNGELRNGQAFTLNIRMPNGRQLGRFQVERGGLRWFSGKKQKNGRLISWSKLIEEFTG